jgi:branched-chain amino acid transport system permease protein
MTRKLWPWLWYALSWVILPMLFTSSLSHNLLSQIGIAVIVCLSYNILLGQGGMLSFGHAVYSGMGAFLAMHTLNAVSSGMNWPVSLIPLVGGASALAVALVLGWISTQKAATPFAMITLGLGELVWSMSLMFPGFFGGEGGISGNRVVGAKVWGISYGPQIELYGLIAVYALVCTALMYALTRTPLGRMLNAVRDNPERVAFIGYDPRMVRYIAFCIAAFFAGFGGGLAALNFEIVTSEVVSAQRSGAYLLFVYLGGAGFFFGPILGAILMVVASVLMSEWTQAWLLYLGLLFVLMVMHVPGGLAGWVMQHLLLWRHRLLSPLGWRYAVWLPVLVGTLAGFAALIEMMYHLQLQAEQSPEMKWGPWLLNTRSAWTWGAVLLWTGVGMGLTHRAWLVFHEAWVAAMNQIESLSAPQANPETATSTPPVIDSEARQSQLACAPTVLELADLTKRFGPTEIIRGVDLQVRQGERLALIGPNGAGKSTLFNLISGRLEPTSGRIALHGHEVQGCKPQHIHRAGLARSFQITHIFNRMSVFENLRCSVLWGQGHGYSFWRSLDRLVDVNQRAEQLLRDVRLEHRREVLAMNLTYAEQRALELAMTLGGGSEVILLDEPTAGMSRAETAYMIGLIRRLTEGKTLIMVEHDMDVVFGLADRVAVLVYGQVIACDTPAQVRSNAQVRQAYLGDHAEAAC